ncbi:MAG: calcium/sodium antiporter [Epsilonproteobacteria bacterium]|nr:calcium/sodium antiporter [Campylobacterota bacterium]
MDIIIFIISLFVLIKGADLLISQAEKIALYFGISQYVIGATLIAIGTSLPEMAASISASINHKPLLALSNVLGSNIINISLVLGSVFLFAKKINPHRDFFAKDSSWALFPVLLFIAIIIKGYITIFDGFILIGLMGAYILFLFKNQDEVLELAQEELKDIKKEQFDWKRSLILSIIALILVIKGADYTIESASNIAKSFGISEWIVGILLVAFGTSLPELVVSIMAAKSNKADMAIGNIIGSNMANITMVLGSAALFGKIELNLTKYLFDLSMLVIVTLMLVFITANRLYSKPAGISLLLIFALFIEHILLAI